MNHWPHPILTRRASGAGGVLTRLFEPVVFHAKWHEWRFLAVVATLQLFVGVDEHIEAPRVSYRSGYVGRLRLEHPCVSGLGESSGS